MKTCRLFVYGTLMSGQPNHGRLGNARLLGRTRTAPGFELYDLGFFPGAVRRGRRRVVGELYEVDPATLRAIDALESHPHFYRRTRIRLDDGSVAETYLLSDDRVLGREMIASGSWCAKEGSCGS